MADYKQVKNAQLESVKDHKQYDPQLIFTINNPLDPEQRIKRDIRLWRSEPGSNEVSEQVLESQEKALRELIGDETITYAPTKEEAKDTDIRFYLEKHAPIEVDGIYQDTNKSFFRIGEPQETSGENVFRTRFEPKHDGIALDFTGYDPNTQFVSVYHALDEKTKDAFDNIDTDYSTDYVRIWQSKKTGLQGVELTNPIVKPIFQVSNSFQDKDDVKPTTRLEFLTSLENKLQKASEDVIKESDLKIDEVKDLKAKLEQNPETVSFNDVMKLVGGTSTPRLHEDLHTSVQKWIRLGSRRALTFFVEHTPSKRVYRTSSLISRKDFTAPQYGLESTFEFFTNDMSRKDVIEFLTNSNLVNFEEVIQDAIDNVLDGSIQNVTKDNNVYAFLNELFVNRRVTTNSSNGMRDPLKMPTYINAFGDYYDSPLDPEVTGKHEDVSDDVIDDATDVILEKEEPLTPDEKSEELATKEESEKKSETESKEDKSKDSNPWGNTMWDADDDPFS